MSITLKQAFTNWSMAPRNLVLSSKYRDGVNQVLMRKYSDTELKEFTKEFATDIMRSSSAARQLKVQAASALVYLLQWGGDHGHCQRPSFSFGDIIPADKPSTGSGTVRTERPKTKAIAIPQEIEDQLKEDTVAESVEADPAEHSQGTQEKKRRAGGRPPKAVAQIDPATLHVMKVWPVIAHVDSALNIGKGNVSRAVRKHQKAAGCYWCYEKDTDAYIKELKRLHPSRRTAKKQDKPAKPETIQDQQEQVAVLKLKYETFNQMRPVTDPEPAKELDPPSFDESQGTPISEREAADTLPNEKPDPQPTPVTDPAPRRIAQPLAVFSDLELFDELERRGWIGQFSKTDVIFIGQTKK